MSSTTNSLFIFLIIGLLMSTGCSMTNVQNTPIKERNFSPLPQNDRYEILGPGVKRKSKTKFLGFIEFGSSDRRLQGAIGTNNESRNASTEFSIFSSSPRKNSQDEWQLNPKKKTRSITALKFFPFNIYKYSVTEVTGQAYREQLQDQQQSRSRQTRESPEPATQESFNRNKPYTRSRDSQVYSSRSDASNNRQTTTSSPQRQTQSENRNVRSQTRSRAQPVNRSGEQVSDQSTSKSTANEKYSARSRSDQRNAENSTPTQSQQESTASNQISMPSDPEYKATKGTDQKTNQSNRNRVNTDKTPVNSDEQSLREILQNGDRKANKGKYTEAIKLFKKAAAQTPDSDAIQTKIGSLNYQLENYPKARDHLRRALAINPQNYLAQHNLGITYYRMQYYDLAVRHLQNALALRPKSKNTKQWLQKAKYQANLN